MYYPHYFPDRATMLNYERMCLEQEMYGPFSQPVPEAVQGAEQSLAEDILDAPRNISDLWRKSGDNTLRIGYWLNALHKLMDAGKFSAYTREDLADLGISRSSTYRWMVLDKNLQRVFPNSVLCNALVRLGDGRGIFAAFRLLDKVAADFGADKFENFRDRMDRLFGPRKNGTADEWQATPADLQSDVQSNVQSNVEAQSQLRTESESRGCPRDSVPT
jgi:hypothetical protein